MTLAKSDTGKAAQPSIRELTVRFLERNQEAESLLAAAAFSEVETHEVAVAFRTEPRQAWQDSLQCLKAFGVTVAPLSPPAEWPGIVARQGPAADLPFALGNHPQRVRDLNTLLQNEDFTAFRGSRPASAGASTALKNWAGQVARQGNVQHGLVAAGVLRACGDYDAAGSALAALRSQVPAAVELALRNEEAALLWDRGEWEKAAALWESMPESTPVLFNRGMANLFLNGGSQARGWLRKAIDSLPDSDCWHHLASLYLALAEIRA